MKKHQSGFTLTELLIIIAVVAVLVAALLLPMALSAKNRRALESLESSPSTVTPVTVGNNSYISVDLSGTPEGNAMVILKALAEFEKNNPGKEVVGWFVEKQQDAHITRAKVFGIWVHHKPKAVALEQPNR